MDFIEKLNNHAIQSNIFLTVDQLSKFATYYRFLIEKNRYVNLTSITEEEEVIDKHFIDSLTCSRIIDMSRIESVIDIGTGAGFPGIPLKIVYPEINFVLVDSLKKRVNFLNDLIDELHLTNIEVVHARAEDLARSTQYRGKFDLCVSRAVASLNTLCEYCIPFIHVDGFFVSYKSVKGLDEIKQSDKCLRLLGSKIVNVEEFSISLQDYKRILIAIQKCKVTSKAYPRKAGIPLKNPL